MGNQQADRELLELAARAAGLGLPGIEDRDEIGRQYCESLGIWAKRPWGWNWWNPLTDDGDALRLAVKCSITDLAIAVGSYVIHETQREGDDIYAITRRAIVRAAAEIGKAMP